MRRNKRKKREESKKNKRGAATHVEIIISFSIFFVFVLFLLTYMNPVKPPGISKVLLDVVEQGLDHYTAKIIEIPVSVSPSVAGCFQIECPFTDCEEDHIFVKDENENICDFSYSLMTGNLSIQGTGQFFYIYYSDKNITYPGSTCSAGISRSSEFSVPKLQTLYLYSELEKLSLIYNNSYEGLKSQFGFPKASDFAIRVYDKDNKLMFAMNITKPKGVAVKARDMPITILKDDTKEKIKCSMNIQVW